MTWLPKKKLILLLLLIISLDYFLLYYYYLGIKLTLISLFFIVAIMTFYFFVRLLSDHKIFAIIRIILASIFFLIVLTNFIFFKVLKTFLPLGKGLVSGLDKSEIVLLLDYLSVLPIGLIISTIIFLAFFVWFDFFYKPVRQQLDIKKIIAFTLITLSTIIIVDGSIIYQPSNKWSSLSSYHADLGPFGYIITDLARLVIKPVQSKSLQAFDISLADYPEGLLGTRQVLAELSQQKDADNLIPVKLPAFQKKPNIIIYQLESVSTWAFNQEPSPMPFLKKLMQDNVSIDHFFGNDCHTIGAEFTSLCSLLPDSGEVISSKLDHPEYYCLPEILSQELGYSTSVYHANWPSFWKRETVLPMWGIENLHFSPEFEVRAADNLVLDTLLDQELDENLHFDYFISFVSHGPHSDDYIDYNLKSNNVVITPYQADLNHVAQQVDLSEHELRNYLGFLAASDQSIQHLFEQLAFDGKLDDTIVIIYGDHRYYGFKNNDLNYYQDYNELPFVMYIPGMHSVHIPITASHIDIAPSILDLLGYDLEVNNFLGKSIFSAQPSNQALGKCGDEVFYYNSDIFIQGNTGLDVFSILNENKLFSAEKDQYLQKFKIANTLSDQILAYPLDFTFADNTIIQSQSNEIYLIKAQQKHLIADENVFFKLGYTWNNVHKISSDLFAKYEEGETITDLNWQDYK